MLQQRATCLYLPGRRQGGNAPKSQGRSGSQTAQQPRRKKPKIKSTAGQAAAMLAAQPARFCSQHLGMLSWLVKHLMTSALMVSPESNDNSFKLLSKSDGILN